MANSKTLIPLLSLMASLFFIMLADKGHCQDSTSFQLDSFDPFPNDLTYQGDAFVPSNSTYLRLTRVDASGMPAAYSVGRVVYTNPVQFWELGRQATFETTIKFLITPVDNNPADGITFFIVPVNYPIPNPSAGSSFGLFDLNTGNASSVFAVEFDTYFAGDNSQWDPNFRHIGIDINSRVSRNVTRLDDPFDQMVTARINYDSPTRRISVVATYGSQTSFLTYEFDLKTVLPQQVQVGISGSTGGQVAIHDIFSWYFTSIMVWDGNSFKGNTKKETSYIKQYV